MEDTIDLGKYLETLIRRWPIVVVPMLAFALVAGLLVFAEPRKYQANVQVAMVSEITSISFDTAIKTVSDRDLALQQGRDQRTASFVALVRNPDVARAVLTRVGPQLPEDLRSIPRLLGMVQANLVKGSDLINIMVTAEDPQIAVLIANAWGAEYEQAVNQLYGGSSQETQATIVQQTRRAKADYETAQAALVQFIGQNRVDELQRTIAEKQQVINSLQQGKQTALSTLIDQEISARKQIAAAYINAQANNRLLAFQKEQEAKSNLWSAYTDADLQARLLVFNKQVEERLNKLSQTYAAKANAEAVLADAKALQAQIAAAGPVGVPSNALALLVLKEQAYASSGSLPGNLQLQLGSLPDLQTSADAQAADLQALISTLQQRIDDLNQEIANQSKALLSNEGYDLQQIGERSPDDPLFAAIESSYKDLFTLDSLANLSGEMVSGNPLAGAGMDKAKELLQLEGLEMLPSYLNEAGPLNQVLDQLQADVRSLQAELTQEQAKKEELSNARDIAWETYTNMSKKAAEVNVGSSLASSVVRLASTTSFASPEDRGLLKQLVISGIVGLLLGIVAAYVVEFWQSYRARMVVSTPASHESGTTAPKGKAL